MTDSMLRCAIVVSMLIMLLLQQATYTSAVNYCTQGTDLGGACCSGDIIISPNATTIIDGAFTNCIGLTSVNFSQATSLTSIDNFAFYNCNQITGDLVIPDSVTCIGDRAFYECSSLNGYLTLGDGLQYIAEAAFQNCTSLTGSLIIPASIIAIDASAFQFDNSFACINVQGNPSIGQNAFDGTVGLSNTTCPTNQPDDGDGDGGGGRGGPGGRGGNKSPSSSRLSPLKLLIVLGASIGGPALLISAIVIGMRIRYGKLTKSQYHNQYQVTKDDDDNIKRINNTSGV